MFALRHYRRSTPENDPHIQNHRGFVGPWQRLVEAKTRRDLDDEDDKQGQKKAAAQKVGGLLQSTQHGVAVAYLVALMRSSKPLGQTLA